jgi:hypothetical protein
MIFLSVSTTHTFVARIMRGDFWRIRTDLLMSIRAPPLVVRRPSASAFKGPAQGFLQGFI